MTSRRDVEVVEVVRAELFTSSVVARAATTGANMCCATPSLSRINPRPTLGHILLAEVRRPRMQYECVGQDACTV